MYFQSDIGRFKQIQLYLSTYISSVPYDSTITIVQKVISMLN